MLDSSLFASRATTAAWLRSLLVSHSKRPEPPSGRYQRDRVFDLLGQLRGNEDQERFRATLLDLGESAADRAAAGQALASQGATLDADDLASYFARLPREGGEPCPATAYSLFKLTRDDAARAALDAGLSRRVAKTRLDLMRRMWGPRRDPVQLAAEQDELFRRLIDTLGEDGLLARLRAALAAPACERSADDVLVRNAQTLLASCGLPGVRVAQELLDAPVRAQTWALVELVMCVTPNNLIARTRLLVEAERDLPQVEAVVAFVARRPRDVDRELLVRAIQVPALRRTAFDGLEALDRDDPTWDERALALAGDDPVLRARVHVRRAHAGDPASLEALFDMAFTAPCDARTIAVEALSALAPERRDLFLLTLVEPRPGCESMCSNELGRIAIMTLTRGATTEDVALMVEAHLVGPWPLHLSGAFDALWGT